MSAESQPILSGTDATPPPASEEARLDEETERLLQAFQIAAGNVWNEPDNSLGSFRWQVAVEDRGLAKAALRSRIRELIEEARESAIRITENAWRTR